MKYSKQASLTTDTRLSQSGIFNNSSLNQSSVPLESGNNFYMSNNIRNSQSREVEFLRIKNGQLAQKNKRLQAHIKQLEESKTQILAINSKYVQVVNRYYQTENEKNEKETISRVSKGSKDINNFTGAQAHRALQKLQKDHRNLVKHCLAMESEIKNYANQMIKFEQMKGHLKRANHQSVVDLIEQIQQLGEQNKNLRKVNNETTYELQKYKQECKKIKRIHGLKQKQAGECVQQISKMRSLINTTQQQSIDKSNSYEARIYELELKVEKLQKQLRQSQQVVSHTKNLHNDMAIKQVQNIHDYQKLQKSYTDLLRTKDRALSLNMRAPRNQANKVLINNSINYAIQRHGNAVRNSRKSFDKTVLAL